MILFFWLLLVNCIGAFVTIHDKHAAQRGAWRVPEKTLFALCILGGCPGVYLTMRTIHHTTRHRRFMIGIPLIFAAQLALFAWLCYQHTPVLL